MIFRSKMAKSSFMLTERSNPSMAFLENLISNISIGTIMGKLNMAIKVLLLFTLAAIADTMVKIVEKLSPPSITAIP